MKQSPNSLSLLQQTMKKMETRLLNMPELKTLRKIVQKMETRLLKIPELKTLRKIA